MKKIVLILSFFVLGVISAFAQSSYNVEKVCYGPGRSAMVVEYNNLYYVIVSNSIPLTMNMVVTDIPHIHFGGYSEMWFYNAPGSAGSDYVNVIKSGQPVFVNNRWQRFFYSGLPGARSVCRQIAFGY